AAEAVGGGAVERGLRPGVGEGVLGVVPRAAEQKSLLLVAGGVRGPFADVAGHVAHAVTVAAAGRAYRQEPAAGQVRLGDDLCTGARERNPVPVEDARQTLPRPRRVRRCFVPAHARHGEALLPAREGSALPGGGAGLTDSVDEEPHRL